MSHARIARIAALYKSGSSTEGSPKPPANVTLPDVLRARQWRHELAKAMADLERRRRHQ
jgi:hypothetical protein